MGRPPRWWVPLTTGSLFRIRVRSRPPYQPRYVLAMPVSSSDAPRGRLAAAKVHLIRTASGTDSHFARLYRVTAATIRDARVGDTWPHHPSPPDNAPRSSWGRRGSSALRSAGGDVTDARRHIGHLRLRFGPLDARTRPFSGRWPAATVGEVYGGNDLGLAWRLAPGSADRVAPS
jgi:hypothetical protein